MSFIYCQEMVETEYTNIVWKLENILYMQEYIILLLKLFRR